MSEEQTEQAPCQICHGEGGRAAFVNHGFDPSIGGCRGSFNEWVACDDCNGTGRWSDERLRRWAIGQAWEARRRATGELLWQSARRLCVTPSEICQMRDGRIPIPEDSPY